MHQTTTTKERAKEARKSHHTMGAPTVRNFKHIIKNDKMSNCPVTLEDIDGAEKIHRKDILHIKGKMTWQSPTTTTIMNITMPKELKEQNTNIMPCMDIMHIDKIGFMTSISPPLHCGDANTWRTTQKIHFMRCLTNHCECATMGDITSRTSNVTTKSRALWMSLTTNQE